MKFLFTAFILLITLITHSHAQNVPIGQELLSEMKQATVLNMDRVIDDLELQRRRFFNPRSFALANPYIPRTLKKIDPLDDLININGIKNYRTGPFGRYARFYHQPMVHNMMNRASKHVRDSRVCAIDLVDQESLEYRLVTFPSHDLALAEGMVVTHQHQCGACSGLHDLAIYLETEDMVTPSRVCARKLGLRNKKDCFIEKIGFSEKCAELWAYNAWNTAITCSRTCLKDYGLANIIRNRFPDDHLDDEGQIRPCILCDEVKSVPAYNYGAGRTRRNSGIISELPRDEDEIYSIDFREYYQLFGLEIPNSKTL